MYISSKIVLDQVEETFHYTKEKWQQIIFGLNLVQKEETSEKKISEPCSLGEIIMLISRQCN